MKSSLPTEEGIDPDGLVLRKGLGTSNEDQILAECVRERGEGNGKAVQKAHGTRKVWQELPLRWTNHLRPSLRKDPCSSNLNSCALLC